MTYQIGLIMGEFHRNLVEIMVLKARRTGQNLGLEIIEEIWVPGSLEKPLALKRLLIRPEISGCAVLGIIEKGETKHGLVMGQAVISAILNIELELMKPVGVGILGPEILPEQIKPRLEPYATKAMEALKTMLEG